MNGSLPGLDDSADFCAAGKPETLVIACGALARELMDIIKLNRFSHMAVTCLPAIWHNTPEKITEGVRGKIIANRDKYSKILCLYGDCGTGGTLDVMLEEEGVERIEGTHCYAFYAGLPEFDALMEEELGSFFLTDYLARFFDRLIIQGFKLEKHPELRDMIFGHYKRLVYLTQVHDQSLVEKAQAAADYLKLDLVIRPVGYGIIPEFLKRAA